MRDVTFVRLWEPAPVSWTRHGSPWRFLASLAPGLLGRGVAFGGGVHYCLGNGVAKTQQRALFSQILTHLPHLDAGEPVYINSDVINGKKRLPAIA